jgi:RNA polymerase sigma-70 factor (ECF subfamily)
MSQDDAILVQRVLTGDRAAFSPLINRHWPSAMRLALRRLGNMADAEDTVQDAFLHAVISLSSLQKADRFGSWVSSIIRAACTGGRIGMDVR